MSQPSINSPTCLQNPSASRCRFDTLVVVGVGLLGGSVALAARQRGIVRRVIGVGRSAARLKQACESRILDEFSTDLVAAAAQADLLIFATPVNLTVAGVREVAAACRPGVLLTDVGSTKGDLCRELSTGLPRAALFIGSHPLAGSEKQGWEHARADLFDGRVCVVTPVESSPPDEVERLTWFWQAIGMSVVEMSPEAHDRALAQTSHVPHVVASALARTLADENLLLASTGFADTTRIAAGDSNVWVPILLDNRDAVLTSLDEFSAQVAVLRAALAQGDAENLRRLWDSGKTIREQLKVRRVPE